MSCLTQIVGLEGLDQPVNVTHKTNNAVLTMHTMCDNIYTEQIKRYKNDEIRNNILQYTENINILIHLPSYLTPRQAAL